MKREKFDHLECPLAHALGLVGEWWTLLVIRDLFYRINTFDELIEDLAIARNILANRLRKLEAAGIVEKRSYQKRPQRYHYMLTKKGRELYPVIMALVGWADKWESPEGRRIIFRHGADGHQVEPRLVCGKCGLELSPRDVKPEPGPGTLRHDALPLPLRRKV
jgi:DNA-binding HxlR family transcriptional regulator